MEMQIPSWDDGRRHPHTLKVHIENNHLTEMLDEWFEANHIRDLQVVSKAWNKLSRWYQRLVASQIERHLELPPDHQYRGHTTWASIDPHEGGAELSHRIILVKSLLEKDLEENKKVVAAKADV
jgi:hypothetical protein